MSGLWLISFVFLWLLVIGSILVILAMAQEIEALHSRLDSLQKYISTPNLDYDGRERISSTQETQTPLVSSTINSQT
jgi:hypothetical protein